MRTSIRAGAAALLIAGAIQPGPAAPGGPQSTIQAAPPQGFEARSEHFRVVTLGPPEIASAAAARLERARAELIALGFALPASTTQVVLFRSAAELQPYLPGRSAGFFQPGTDASFLASVWGTPEEARALVHELAHQALLPVAAGYPLWLREGLADLLSNLELVAGGLKVGSPITAHLEALKRGTADCGLIADAVSDPSLKASPMFYPMSWLAAHHLVVGRPFAGNLAERVRYLGHPSPPGGCKPPDLLLGEIIPAASGAEPTAATARSLKAWEWEHHMAELLRALGRTDEARAALVALRGRFAGRPEPVESLGALEMDLVHPDLAEEWLAEAVRLGSETSTTYYRLSLLLMRPGKSFGDALRYARRAVALDATHPLYWLTQAQAEMQLSLWDESRRSLEQMQARTADPELRKQVRVEMAEVDRRREEALRPAKLDPPQPAVVITAMREPEPRLDGSVDPGSDQRSPDRQTIPSAGRSFAPVRSWPPPGTLLFMGRIQGVECSADTKILTVVNSRFSVRVRDRGAAPARLYSPPAKISRIPCSMKSVDVNVVYRPLERLDPQHSLNGDLVAVVF